MSEKMKKKSLLWGHETGGHVNSVSTSSDGSYVAAGCFDEKVYFFDRNGKLLWSHKTDDDVYSVSTSSDGSYVAAGSKDKKVYFFDREGELLWNHGTGGVVESVSTSSDGSYVAAGSWDTKVYFFDRNGKLLWNHGTGGVVESVSTSSDGSYVAAGSWDTKVYFFDRNGKLLWNHGTGGVVESVSTSSDGSYVAAGSGYWDKKVYFFDRKGNLLWSHKTGGFMGVVDSVSTSSDGSYVAAGSKDKKVYFFNRDGKLLWTHKADKPVWSVSTSSDGSYVAAGSRDKKVYFFDRDGNLLWSHNTGNYVESVSTSSDGSYVAAGSGDKVYFFRIEIVWQKKASTAISELKAAINEADKLGIDTRGFNRIEQVFAEEDYEKAYKEAEKLKLEISNKKRLNQHKQLLENTLDIVVPERIVYGSTAKIQLRIKGVEEPLEELSVDLSEAEEYFKLSESSITFPTIKPGMDIAKEVELEPLFQGSFNFNLKVSAGEAELAKEASIEVGKEESYREEVAPSDFTPRPTHTSSFPPELEEYYEDPEYIGKGGFARVFKVKRKSDGEEVAVKVPISLDASTGRSFMKEITVWQRLNHENIVSLQDVNIMPVPYLEMELCEGGSLEDISKPMEPEEAATVVLDIAEGLKHAHSMQRIHRDLKPGNILLKGGAPKITDWGLSKVMAESKHSSKYGFSPMYAAPEQISPKKFGRPEERTDIWQLGVVFYELLTGKPPFEGGDMVEITSAIVMEEPQSLAEINPELKELEPIVHLCLQKSPDDRYSDMEGFQGALADYLGKEYKKSLKQSVSQGNMKRSAFYCGKLCLVYARIGDMKEVLKFANDLKYYANSNLQGEVEGLIENARHRMEEGMGPDEDFNKKLEVLIHQLRMGWK